MDPSDQNELYHTPFTIQNMRFDPSNLHEYVLKLGLLSGLVHIELFEATEIVNCIAKLHDDIINLLLPCRLSLSSKGWKPPVAIFDPLPGGA